MLLYFSTSMRLQASGQRGAAVLRLPVACLSRIGRAIVIEQRVQRGLDTLIVRPYSYGAPYVYNHVRQDEHRVDFVSTVCRLCSNWQYSCRCGALIPRLVPRRSAYLPGDVLGGDHSPPTDCNLVSMTRFSITCVVQDVVEAERIRAMYRGPSYRVEDLGDKHIRLHRERGSFSPHRLKPAVEVGLTALNARVVTYYSIRVSQSTRSRYGRPDLVPGIIFSEARVPLWWLW